MTATQPESEGSQPIEEDPTALSGRPTAISATRPGASVGDGADAPAEPHVPAAVPSGHGRAAFRHRKSATIAVICVSSLLLGLAIGLLLGSPPDELEVVPAGGPTAALDLRAVAAGSPARGTLEVRDEAGAVSLELEASGLTSSKPGDFYSAWLRDGRRSLALGGFRVGPSRAADAVFPLPVRLQRFSRFEIRRERADGDPAPGGRAVLRVPTR